MPNLGKNPNPNLNSPRVNPPTLHENEDYHSGPNPLSGVPYMTSTQARFYKEEYTGHQESKDPGHHPNYYTYALPPYGPYNQNDKDLGKLNTINHSYV